MKTTKNTVYYLIAISIFIGLKFAFKFADIHDLYFLLKPTDKLVGIFLGSQSIYHPDQGFYHENLNILIDKSCSGFNFWMLCFLVFSYLFLKYVNKRSYRILCIPIVMILAYLLTVVVNASRIFASILAQEQTKNLFADQQHLIHEVIGIITYFTFLLLTYYFTEKLLSQRYHNEKLT